MMNKLENKNLNDEEKMKWQEKIKKKALENWFSAPISYRQLSNIIDGSNRALHTDLINKNGSQDILQKTLLIIDEAHNLYDDYKDRHLEKPDMNVIEKAIQNSYNVSKNDSVRILLLSATPFRNDPMELIKLLNLLKEKNHFPTDFQAFSQEYLNEQSKFTDRGAKQFLNNVAGHISYLNRSSDVSQFAQPFIKNVMVPMSFSQSRRDAEEYTTSIKRGKSDIKYWETLVENDRKELATLESITTNYIDQKRRNGESKIYDDEDYILAKQRIDGLKDNIKSQQNKVKTISGQVDALKKKIRNIKIDKNDKSQEAVLLTRCLNKK
jgi:hypothetical protein